MKKNYLVYIIFTPAFLYLLLFHYIPMFGIVIAFEDFKVARGVLGSDWVGLQNFVELFTGESFPVITSYSIHYTKLYDSGSCGVKITPRLSGLTWTVSAEYNITNKKNNQEVILNILDKDGNIVAYDSEQNGALIVVVITSYSIHYTKLYEISAH